MTISSRRFNLAFCGCGFLGMYQTGVVAALRTHANGMMDTVDKVGGSSSGSLNAAMLVCDVPVERSFEFGLRTAAKIRSNKWLIPWANLDKEVRECAAQCLPDDAHLRATDRLHVSVSTTGLPYFKNELVSSFSSREELIDALAQSCFLPMYSGFKPSYRGKRWAFDGSFTDNRPILQADADTDNIIVSPFAGKAAVISPALSDTGWTLFDISYKKTPFTVSKENLKRINPIMLIPPKTHQLKKLYITGYSDTKLFLQREGLYEEAAEPDVLHLFDEGTTVEQEKIKCEDLD